MSPTLETLSLDLVGRRADVGGGGGGLCYLQSSENEKKENVNWVLEAFEAILAQWVETALLAVTYIFKHKKYEIIITWEK